MRWLVALTSLLLSACSTTISPPSTTAAAPDSTFSHRLLDEVLMRYVDDEGRIDYGALQAAPQQLERYYGMIAAFSPDSHPDLFADEVSKKAYWINAYNAAVLMAVLQSYPITSVSDVSGPPLSGLLSDQIGFFYFQKLIFGGRKINLYNLEHEVIRERFPDPRIHFAINCASGGCPRLPASAFHADRLDGELHRETVRFVNEERNLRVDDDARVVHLSSIFVWYRDDFTNWLQSAQPDLAEPTLLDYVLAYVDVERAPSVERARSEGYEIRAIPYDWSLNDQGG